MPIVLPTNADTDLYDVQVGTGTTLTFTVPTGFGYSVEGTYHFDASDAGPTDAGSAWTGDSQAFNGVTSNYAGTVSLFDTPGILKGTGTTAPVSGLTIDRVQVRVGVGFSSLEWTDWKSLEVPSGGWTHAKLQALHVDLDAVGTGTYHVDISVSDGGQLLTTFSTSDLGGSVGTWRVRKVEMQVLSLATDHHYLILATGDDDFETWTSPTNFTEFFQVNNATNDDASVGAWWAKASDITTPTVDLVRVNNEEQVGVMMVVQGADTTTFEDLAFSEGTHFVATNNVDGTPNVTPQPIDTATDDAVVIILTGNRSNTNHWGGSGTTWDVDPPADYTIESATNVASNNTAGAPGRLKYGEGAGDAMFTWMWKTVSSAGTETPGQITGFTGGRDHLTVTFAIRPAAVDAGTTVTPGVVVSTVAVDTPTITAASKVTPGVISRSFAVPTPVASIPGKVTPGVIARSFTVDTPTITAAAKVTPNVVAVSFVVPTPVAAAAAVVTPSTIAIVAAAPGATITIAPTVQPNVVGATTTIPPPSITAAAVVTPAAVATSVAVPTPAVTAASVVTPAVIARSLTVPTPTIDVSAGATTVTPDAVVTTATVPTPALDYSTAVNPGVVVTTVTVPTPTPSIPKTVTPATVVTTITAPTPPITAAAKVTPSAVVTVVTVPTPTALAASVVTPAVVVSSVTVPTPALDFSTAVNPGVVVSVVAVPTPTPSIPGDVSPSLVVTTVTVPTPTIDVAGGTLVTPDAVVTTVTVPTPAITAASTVTPSTVVTVVTVPTPTPSIPATVTPATVVTTVTVPTPTALAASVVTPAVVVVTVAIPQVTLVNWHYTLRTGYDVARFFRMGGDQFVLVSALSRNAAVGYKKTENWYPGSGKFAEPSIPSVDVMGDVAATWITYRTVPIQFSQGFSAAFADLAVLYVQINIALTANGFVRPDGSAVT